MMSKEEPTGSIGVGDRVRIIGGGPMARGLIGVVQRLDTSRQGRCYVTSGGKIYAVQTDELILHNGEVHNKRRELTQPIGSLFWRKRSYGQRFYLKVTTHRGCKEPGYYTWEAWADPSKVRAYLEGKISLGVFDSEESAREACESHYLANKKTGGHEPATMKSNNKPQR